MVNLRTHYSGKTSSRAMKSIFIRYPFGVKGYRFRLHDERKCTFWIKPVRFIISPRKFIFFGYITDIGKTIGQKMILCRVDGLENLTIEQQN